MRSAIVCGMVTGDLPVSYWPIFFFQSLVTVPGVFAQKVNSAQFPSLTWRIKFKAAANQKYLTHHTTSSPAILLLFLAMVTCSVFEF